MIAVFCFIIGVILICAWFLFVFLQGYMQSQAPAAQQWGGMVSQPPAQNTYGAPAAAASGSDNPFR